MKYLITGATGFVGSHIADQLASENHEIVCLVRDIRRLRYLRNGNPVQAKELFERIKDGELFDCVIHAAGATRALTYAEYQKANVELTRSLLEALHGSKNRNHCKFLYVSSQAAVGPSKDGMKPVSESDEPNPVSDYGRSKLEAERVVMDFSSKMFVTIVRPGIVFGPRDSDVYIIFKSAKSGLVPYLAGPSRWVNLIYVKDLVRGILAATNSENTHGKVYHLIHADSVKWLDFVLSIARAMNRKVVAVPIPVPVMRTAALFGDVLGRLLKKPQLLRMEKFNEMNQIAWLCSPDAAERDFGFRATTPTDVAIRQTISWYMENGRL